MKGVFVTGTGTHVGKTFISSLLCRALAPALQKNKREIAYFKPVQTGVDEDCLTVEKLSHLSVSEIAKPVYHFREPISPNRAAALNQTEIKLETILETWEKLSSKFCVVEGAGGVLVPLNAQITLRDLMHELSIPVIVVASTELGTINHTLLTLEALKHKSIPVLGVVLNGKDDPGLAEIIEAHSGAQVLAEIPHFSQPLAQAIKAHANTNSVNRLLQAVVEIL